MVVLLIAEPDVCCVYPGPIHEVMGSNETNLMAVMEEVMEVAPR